ncbi:glutamate--cysteine ligase [Quadrisphaera setariae]|uniref:Glutamate--cysteine ligase n=1 Tax=Quadrisphaera setariae TaxID=2593304 RepID=A0A5C8ZGI6_9ACTN|nr:glutamate--cysteine ligase [Quadrisphaera setariae]TXR56674.1 glutamate--cysteine ligase [Quadrisphaera setariae]
MGQEVDAAALGRERRRAHRERLALCLGALEGMLTEHARGRARFEDDAPRVGVELELVLVDPASSAPLRANDAVLQRIAAASGPGASGGPGGSGGSDGKLWGPEISAHTLEVNLPPGALEGRGLAALERGLRSRLDAAHARAGEVGGRLLMTGLLPTLLPEHTRGDWMTPSARYRALQEAVLEARGEDLALDVEAAPGTPGGQRLSLLLDTLAAEGACTSTQVHLKVAPEQFAASWNAAQLLMGPQLALGANSPFAFGARCWEESRVPVFTQAVDTRPPELAAAGAPPRVFSGSDWLDAGRGALAAWDLFAENVRDFPPLLPQTWTEDPAAELAAGRAPRLPELCLQGGTVWRWNRPVYDVAPSGGAADRPERAHLRIENRVLPAAPTVLDAVADAAVWLGAVHALRTSGPDPALLLPHSAVVAGLHAGAREGLRARLPWPGLGMAEARRLLLDQVLPLAADGLAAAGVAAAEVDRYLQVAQERATTGRTGAQWQARALAALEERGADRRTALAGVVERYADHQDGGEPVHTWPDLA